MQKPSKSREEWLKLFKDIAQERGGECLSDKYLNIKTKLRWLCAKGHEWESNPNNIRQGNWCPHCAGRLRLTIDDMRSHAMEKGGECLSTEYVNSTTKLRWKCAKGHEWEAVPSSIRQGVWCPHCVRKAPLNLKAMQVLARARGGECVSTEYLNVDTKLRWQCAKGHEWEAKPDSVKNSGAWCPVCAGRRIHNPMERLRVIAQERGGECLSTEYTNSKAKLHWRCAEGHEWVATLNDVGQGAWCHKCGGSMPLTMDDIRATAHAKGGECLSTEYINSNTKLRWRCAEGHEWWATASHIRLGGWCPTCSAGNSERICKDIFEQLFEKPFPKVKLKWLLNSRGKKMELDGYCKDIHLAFEYHGEQHYKHNRFFHREGQSLRQRQEDDALKHQLCREHGIHLIEIPYSIPLKEVPEHVHHAIQDRGLTFPMKRSEEVRVATYVLPEKLRIMQAIAELRNGKCLSYAYVNNNTKLRWKCAQGHEWEAVPGSIQQGSWCPQCSGNVLLTLEDMKKIARARGGECLSTEYINSKTKLHWRCAKGHEWEAKLDNIQSGKWCPVCSGRVILNPMERMKSIAEAHSGQCLSTEYVNSTTKLRWKCANGHEWESSPNRIQQGRWCPDCKGQRIWETRRKKISPK